CLHNILPRARLHSDRSAAQVVHDDLPYAFVRVRDAHGTTPWTFPPERCSGCPAFLRRSPKTPAGPKGPPEPKTPCCPNGPPAPKVTFGEGGIGRRGGCGHSDLGPLRSGKASMTARMSHALVEIPSDEAISSTRALTDCGSRSVMRATGSSSVSKPGES